MDPSHGSNAVFRLSDLHFGEFGINEFGVYEAAEFAASRGTVVVMAVHGAHSAEKRFRVHVAGHIPIDDWSRV